MHLIVGIVSVSGGTFTVSYGSPPLMFLHTPEIGLLSILTVQIRRPKFCKIQDNCPKEQCQDLPPICQCVPCASPAD